MDYPTGDKPLRGTGGVPFSELLRCFSVWFCSFNVPSTCSVFNGSSTSADEALGESELRSQVSACRISILQRSFLSEDLLYIPMTLSSFHVRMRSTSRGDAEPDRDRVFIALVNGGR